MKQKLTVYLAATAGIALANVLRQLRPERIYLHDVSVVVVLTSMPGKAQGLYICVPEASMMPSNGTDGFMFERLGSHVYQFEREQKATIDRSAATSKSALAP